jgi:hypothetical protein
VTIPAFPLQWPAGWKRTAAAQRKRANFGKKTTNSGKSQLSIADALKRVRAVLMQMGVRDYNLIISTNVALRQDGWPRSDGREPADPGVAVYWQDTSKEGWPRRCMAIDMYDRAADNLAAVAASLDALRAVKRHGGAEILDRTFTGFTAIEHKKDGHWSDVLGCDRHASSSDVREAMRRARSAAHPDNGGTPGQFQKVMEAYQQACIEHGIAE